VRPVYKIKHSVKRKKDIYEIIKPNGKAVNQAKFGTPEDAKKKLKMLIAMGYCKGE